MRKGSHVSEEQRARMSAAQKNRKFSEEHRAHLAEAIRKSWEDPDIKAARSGENHHLHGKHLDPETIEKLRAARKGQHTGEGNPMYGKHHSEETKRKLAEVQRGRTHTKSPETCAKLSAALRGKVKSSEHIEKLRASKKGKYVGQKNPMYGKTFSEDSRKKMRKAIIEKWEDPAYRAKVTAGQRRVNRSGENGPMYGKPATHSRGDWFTLPNEETIWLRSSYEVRVIKALLKANIVWRYEPKIFPLKGMGKTYCPDIYLPEYDIWWEIKGYWRDDAKEKFKVFCEQYPEERLNVLYKEDIKLLECLVDSGEIIDIMNFGQRC